MHQTFEELAGHHIDGLYHGALFLTAGEEPPAEDLVLWTLTGAFRDLRQIEGAGGLEQWLEARLVAVFLARAGADSTDEGSTDAFSGGSLSPDGAQVGDVSVEIDPEALFGAAAHMPPLARAAVWLVVFRRWTYGDASSVLEMEVSGLRNLLGYRHVLLTAVVGRSVDRNGTDHDRSN